MEFQVKRYIRSIGFTIIFGGLLLSGCSYVEEHSDNLPKSEKYDYVLCQGDGNYIVTKRVDSFEGSYDLLGVVDSKGNFVQEMSAEHPFISDGQVVRGAESVLVSTVGVKKDEEELREELRIRDLKNCMHYLGEDVFAIHYNTSGGNNCSFIFYNAKNGNYCDAGVCPVGVTNLPGHSCEITSEFYEGYLTIVTNRSIKIFDTECNIYEPNFGYSNDSAVGKYSEGMIFVGNAFFDIEGNIIIDLSEYDPSQFLNLPYFENGKCRLVIDNGNGVAYETEIDKEGNFLYEPKKLKKEIYY